MNANLPASSQAMIFFPGKTGSSTSPRIPQSPADTVAVRPLTSGCSKGRTLLGPSRVAEVLLWAWGRVRFEIDSLTWFAVLNRADNGLPTQPRYGLPVTRSFGSINGLDVWGR